MRRLMCVTVAVLLLARVGLAQDPVKVDPKHHKVEFEDNQVRVLRITSRTWLAVRAKLKVSEYFSANR